MFDQDEFYNSDTLSMAIQQDDMSSSHASSSNPDSLYAPPSPRTLHCVAQKDLVSHYTSLRNVLPLSLNGASDPAAQGETPKSTNALQTFLPLPHSDPSYDMYQATVEPTKSSPEPLSSGSFRVVSRDPPPVTISSCTPIDGNSRIRLKEKSTRAKIDLTDPFAEEKYEQPVVSLQARLSEKRKHNSDLRDISRKLGTAFTAKKSHNSEGPAPVASKIWCYEHYTNDTCFGEAKRREGSKYVSSQPPIVNGQSTRAQLRPFTDFPPSGKVLAGTLRLPNCYTCTYNENARHVHDIEEENRYRQILKSRAEEQRKEQGKNRLRVQEERWRRQTQTEWCWSGPAAKSSVVMSSPTATWIEDVSDMRSNPSTSARSKDEDMAVPATGAFSKACVQAIEDLAPPKVDLKDELKAESKTLTPSEQNSTSGQTPGLRFLAHPVNTEEILCGTDVNLPQAQANLDSAAPKVEPDISTSPASPVAFSHRRASGHDGLAEADSAAKVPSPAHKKNAELYTERSKLRSAARKLVAAERQAEENAQWDDVDLSDDEEWDKVAADEGDGWELLEK
ncbi:hypothetical protein E8E12_002932 [Didymella heteroderae]|uniref:Uncharacterized protein n=1 Tax=Didymella heteroderae TaxID=1769908 RepID=A0A9P4WPD1_9PLEO|nr:hypothetical protein E8E12_002932 [Didymella heteroderae]